MYKLVYNIDNSIFPFIKFPLFFLGMLIILFFISKEKASFLSKIALWFATIFLSAIFIITLYSGISKKYRLSRVKPNIIEGEIEKFVPMPYGGHAYESFMVDGVSFSYSDYAITGCFNETKSHGSAIEGDGQRVKIAYTGNCIMRLWVKIKEIK